MQNVSPAIEQILLPAAGNTPATASTANGDFSKQFAAAKAAPAPSVSTPKAPVVAQVVDAAAKSAAQQVALTDDDWESALAEEVEPSAPTAVSEDEVLPAAQLPADASAPALPAEVLPTETEAHQEPAPAATKPQDKSEQAATPAPTAATAEQGMLQDSPLATSILSIIQYGQADVQPKPQEQAPTQGNLAKNNLSDSLILADARRPAQSADTQSTAVMPSALATVQGKETSDKSVTDEAKARNFLENLTQATQNSQPAQITSGIQFVSNTQLVANNQAPVAPSYDVPVNSPEWGKGLMERVTTFHMKSDSNVEIRLNPVELGPIAIHVRIADTGSANIQFVSHSADIRSLVEQSLPHLKSMLSDQGISLGQTSVGDHSSSGESSQFLQKGSDFNELGADEADVAAVQPDEVSGIIAGRVNLYA